MRLITALLHTSNDALRLGRCLETLHPCDEILIIDHGSSDNTLRIAREYGAKIVVGGQLTHPSATSADSTGWFLCMSSRESLTEALAGSLFEWKLSRGNVSTEEAFSILLREERSNGWFENPEAQTRLVPRQWIHWSGRWPVAAQPTLLEGRVLRFRFP
jgi:glycosyltransferase involved in cell wall biosynthesis